MAYNTNSYFFIFLPIVMLVYQILPSKFRWISMLLSSIVFFWIISEKLIIWALIATVITFFCGLWIEKAEEHKNKKLILIAGIIAAIGILVGLKYTNYSLSLLTDLSELLNMKHDFTIAQIMIPIGISFYTLQAVGYLLDVSWGVIKAESNIFKFMLFMLFFPTLMEGPICKYGELREQLIQGKAITSQSIVQGALRIGFGLFKRMLISDRLAVVIDNFYRADSNYTGVMVLMCAILTTIQLYMEFSGTIDIVIGTALIFNIELPENFRQPFLAKSAAEFWRRWHITLGRWFKTYIFYPVTTSKLVKRWNKYGRKKLGKYITKLGTSALALFPVWILNGLWHGPKTPYIMYGVYYFIVLIMEIALQPVGDKICSILKQNPEGKFVSWIRIIRTWVIVILGEMLFRSNDLSQFFKMCKNLFAANGDFTIQKIFDMGMGYADFGVIIVATIIVFVVEYRLERNPKLIKEIPTYTRVKRWSIYYGLIIMILIFGAYGTFYKPVDLIYANF